MTLTDALRRRGITFRTGRGDTNKVHVNCPFCVERGKAPDTKFRLCIHASRRWGKCVHCEWSGRNVIRYVLKRLGVSEIPDQYERAEAGIKEGPLTLPEDFTVLTDGANEFWDRKARRYLLRRGITDRQIQVNRIGACYSGRFAYRILFNTYINKELKFINARDFTGKQQPKYLNTTGEKYLYHFNPLS